MRKRRREPTTRGMRAPKKEDSAYLQPVRGYESEIRQETINILKEHYRKASDEFDKIDHIKFSDNEEIRKRDLMRFLQHDRVLGRYAKKKKILEGLGKLEEVLQLMRRGYSEKEARTACHISKDFFDRYKGENLEYAMRVEKARYASTVPFIAALDKCATGAIIKEETVYKDDAGNVTGSKEVIKELAPDPKAIIARLKQLDRETWTEAKNGAINIEGGQTAMVQINLPDNNRD